MRNVNHPPKGASIKVQPIRSREAIDRIKQNLKGHPRNLCLFTMGINTAYRANELLSIRIGQVVNLRAGDILDLKQSKNRTYRATALNGVTINALQDWLSLHPKREDLTAPLFMSQHYRHKALSVAAVNSLVKVWCAQAGLSENYGSHSLRKTWGYHQRIYMHSSVALLMCAFGHASEAQTLDYLGILAEEVRELYMKMEL